MEVSYMSDEKSLSSKIHKELTEWACDKRYKLPLDYGDKIEEILEEAVLRLKEDMFVPLKGDRVGFVINEFKKRIDEIFGSDLI